MEAREITPEATRLPGSDQGITLREIAELRDRATRARIEARRRRHGARCRETGRALVRRRRLGDALLMAATVLLLALLYSLGQSEAGWLEAVGALIAVAAFLNAEAIYPKGA